MMPEIWYTREYMPTEHALDALPDPLFPDGSEGLLIGIIVMHDGEPYTLTGDVSGTVELYGESPITISGSRDENKASVVLRPEMFPHSGLAKIVIRYDGVPLTIIGGYYNGD